MLMTMPPKILVTGSNGFLGTNFYQYMRVNHPEVECWCFDRVYRQDILNQKLVDEAIQGKTHVIHFAAETHVDNSISGPESFMTTNFIGTYNILEACKKHGAKLVFISTSEVYGSMAEGYTIQDETHPLNPQSPYAASKCAADRLCYSYFKTYGMPVVTVRPFNQFGNYQACEKAIPLFIDKAAQGLPLPVYGDGLASRDWLFVKDTVSGVWAAAEHLAPGEVVNLATAKTYTLIELVELIKKAVGRHDINTVHVTATADRPGHVQTLIGSYAKAEKLMGWKPKYDLEEALKITADWYFANGKIMPPPMWKL